MFGDGNRICQVLAGLTRVFSQVCRVNVRSSKSIKVVARDLVKSSYLCWREGRGDMKEKKKKEKKH